MYHQLQRFESTRNNKKIGIFFYLLYRKLKSLQKLLEGFGVYSSYELKNSSYFSD